MSNFPSPLQHPTPSVCLIRLSPRHICRGLTVIVVGLILAGVAGQLSKYLFNHDVVFGLVRLFNLDAEANVPTWYSSSLLLLCSTLLAVIGQTKWHTD